MANDTEELMEMAELEAELNAPYYDQEMADIIADAAEKEIREIHASVLAEEAVEQDYLDQLAAARFAEQNGSPAGYAQDL